MWALSSRAPLLSLFCMTLGLVLSSCAEERRDRNPVTLQRSAADGATIKVVPVYYDERDSDARARLFASIDCVPYDVLDEGTYTGALFGDQGLGHYYLYIRYRCAGLREEAKREGQIGRGE